MGIVSEQVKIMLDRMDMYPEEFVHPFESRNIETKWNDILQEGRFNWIEKFLIKRKYIRLKRQATRDAIMATIMHDKTKEPPNYFFDAVSRVVAKTKKQKYDY